MLRGVELAAVLLDLAVITASLGLAYRYLTGSTARLYCNSLNELLGAWANELLGSPFNAEFRLRGPLQLVPETPLGWCHPAAEVRAEFGLPRHCPNV